MKLRKSFDTLPQRIFYNYLLCLSQFRPVKSDEASEQSQAQMHSLCEDILRSLYEDSSLMNIKVEPDDCFKLHVCNNRKPELSKSFRKAGEQMGNLYRFLCHAAVNGNIDNNTLVVTLDKKQLKAAGEALNFLPHMGFIVEKDGLTVTLTTEKYPLVFPAMRLLTLNNTLNGQVTGATLFAFAMGLFDSNTDYLIAMIEREMELEPNFFEPYFSQMLQKGYRFSRNYDWCPEGPTFAFRYNNDVSGVSICFDMRKIHQLHFALSTQIGVKAICEDFENQPQHIKDFLVDRLSDCNNCLGCTKGGKNAKFAVAVTLNGEQRLLCPNSIWIGHQVEYINHKMMKALVGFSALQAQYGDNWRKPKKK